MFECGLCGIRNQNKNLNEKKRVSESVPACGSRYSYMWNDCWFHKKQYLIMIQQNGNKSEILKQLNEIASKAIAAAETHTKHMHYVYSV